MPEFRQNLATKEWVIVAWERAKRPHDFQKDSELPKELPPFREDCPFCPGNESKTPPAVFSISARNVSDWSVRVVPNKFAALNPNLSTKREQRGKFLRADGFGIAEVIIETPLHNLTIATMDAEQVQKILLAYKQRYLEVAQSKNINLITIFRNFGVRAGTSLEHPHSQLIATPIIPPHVRDPFQQAMYYYDSQGSCVYCDMVNEELEQKERIVLESKHFVAACPFASRTPFETRIWPKRHTPAYGQISEAEVADLAYVLKTVLAKIRIGLNAPHYNYVIRSAPIGDEDTRYLHWYMVIIPKITTPAGFEIGTGIYINVVPPEQAAKYLREVEIK